ncbi:MAG TPA: hypothetical protein DFR83_05715 [Deltaproteobacteria bacterium]|nr:hypothetical protein [Deltaproteobacteria bacterium]
MNIRPLMAMACATFSFGCFSAGGGKDDVEVSEAEVALNAWLRDQYPEGHAPRGGNVPETQDPNPGRGVSPVYPGQLIRPTVTNPDVGGGIVSMCIAFGSPSSGWCIPVEDDDVTVEGNSAAVDFTLPPELCDGLSQICHDVRCYEFAETEFGTFTAADIEYLASACGQCDEPSCQDLISECEAQCLTDEDCGAEEACLQGVCVGGGALRFSLSWSSSTDFDLHVVTPSGALIGFEGSSSADSGEWDQDNTSGGSGSTENIFFSNPLNGEYQYYVNHYSGDAGSFSLFVTAGDQILASHTESLGGGDSPRHTITFTDGVDGTSNSNDTGW